MSDHPNTQTAETLAHAVRLVASRRLAAASALQRWMRISFLDATALLDQMHEQGLVGPADGSKSRDVFVRCCEQCGRIGKRGFRDLVSEENDIRITVCANKSACRKRWPKPARDDA